MSMPTSDSPHPFYAIEPIRELLRQRRPRADAEHEVEVSAPPARSVYISNMRITGPRESVLDYAAFLLAPGWEAPDGSHTHPELVAVEHDREGELTLLLTRPTFGGGDAR